MMYMEINDVLGANNILEKGMRIVLLVVSQSLFVSMWSVRNDHPSRLRPMSNGSTM
jgi:hypothetical protein